MVGDDDDVEAAVEVELLQAVHQLTHDVIHSPQRLTQLHTHMYTHTHTNTHTNTNTHIHTNTHRHTHTHKCIDPRTHTQIIAMSSHTFCCRC